MNVLNEDGKNINIDLLYKFKIEEYNKEYIIYTLNDEESSDSDLILIAGVEDIDGKYNLKLIPEEESKMVLLFYDNIRDTILDKR